MAHLTPCPGRDPARSACPSERTRQAGTASARQRGIALIWTVLIIFLLLGLIGLAIDTLHIVLANQQLQTSADAAALAGAQQGRFSVEGARQQAIAYADANPVYGAPVELEHNWDNLEDGDIVLGRYDREAGTFTATLNAPNAVLVNAHRHEGKQAGRLPLFFGPIFGVQAVDLHCSAIALMGGGTGAGLITLSDSASCSFTMSGSSQLRVNDGSVQVNSDHNTAACNTGTAARLHAPQVNVYGGVGNNFDAILGEETFLNDWSETYVPDPLIDLPSPVPDYVDMDSPLESPSPTEVATLEPGYYPDGLRLTSGDFTLEPGIYVLDGDGLDLGGGGTFDASSGVMFYIIGDGVVDSTGSGEFVIRPPDPVENDFDGADIFEGVSIYQSRTNHNDGFIRGTGLLDIDGTIYFPNNHVTLSGTSDNFGNQLIVDTMEVTGDGDITINYDGRNPAAGFRVFLVR